ncbi:MAG: type II toxin-antitoxin system RelE/ParE family toxin [Verrucomicrobiaceae bacterium]|nr:type II toxin-antitoxin system RelE/ParE family toxin [Verrucomicrobiaceae bacterium]
MPDPGQILWTERASADIEAIVRYIVRRDPEAAGRIGRGIYARVQILLEYPEAGSALDELREGGWRKLIYRRWKIIYTVRESALIVGRVWPAAMGEADLTTPLDSDE